MRILAEESGRQHGAKHSEYLWIIDPLDGTTNFIHGLPVYAVSIALAFRGKVEQAVVYDPSRNDLFYASKGRGAFLNDRRLRVSKRIRMAEALIGTGFPFRKGDNLARYMKMMEAVMSAVRRPAPPRRRRARPLLRRGRLVRRLLRDRPEPVGRRCRLADDHRGRRPDRQLHRRGRLPLPARGGGRLPEDLRPAGADARAVHARHQGRRRDPRGGRRAGSDAGDRCSLRPLVDSAGLPATPPKRASVRVKKADDAPR